MVLGVSPVFSRYHIPDWFSSWGGVLQLGPGSVGVESLDERVCVDRASFKLRAKGPETTMISLSTRLDSESVLAITRFQTAVSWHFHSLKDEVLKIEL